MLMIVQRDALVNVHFSHLCMGITNPILVCRYARMALTGIMIRGSAMTCVSSGPMPVLMALVSIRGRILSPISAPATVRETLLLTILLFSALLTVRWELSPIIQHGDVWQSVQSTLCHLHTSLLKNAYTNVRHLYSETKMADRAAQPVQHPHSTTIETTNATAA